MSRNVEGRRSGKAGEPTYPIGPTDLLPALPGHHHGRVGAASCADRAEDSMAKRTPSEEAVEIAVETFGRELADLLRDRQAQLGGVIAAAHPHWQNQRADAEAEPAEVIEVVPGDRHVQRHEPTARPYLLLAERRRRRRRKGSDHSQALPRRVQQPVAVRGGAHQPSHAAGSGRINIFEPYIGARPFRQEPPQPGGHRLGLGRGAPLELRHAEPLGSEHRGDGLQEPQHRATIRGGVPPAGMEPHAVGRRDELMLPEPAGKTDRVRFQDGTAAAPGQAGLQYRKPAPRH